MSEYQRCGNCERWSMLCVCGAEFDGYDRSMLDSLCVFKTYDSDHQCHRPDDWRQLK